MWLRTLMVVAVASLGLDSPAVSRVQDLARDAQGWCGVQFDRAQNWWDTNARMSWVLSAGTYANGEADAASPQMPNGSHAFAVEPGMDMPADMPTFAQESRAELDSDEPFTAVVDELAVAFASEVEPAPPDHGLAEPREWLSAVAAPALELEPITADALADDELDGDADFEWTQTLPNLDPGASADQVDAPPGSGKLTTALRLTGQAVQAWLSVLPIAVSAD